MKLSEYFENTKGKGVMSTADSSGNLTAAVYARPHFVDDGTVAFIMADHLTHKNLESNPHAVYLFMESGEKYAGERVYLTKTKEEKNSPLIDTLRRKESCPVDEEYMKQNRYLVHFKIDKTLPLIGDKE
jgi:Pyridoxamine 5'-phosphate oxidase